MTNSYNLSLKHKIVFIHGMNNNLESFFPIMEHFKKNGHETELVILPGHEENRKKTHGLREALSSFEQSMKKYQGTPYIVIAFSQGALYLQLWLEKNPDFKPIKQVLLAPALYLHRQKIIEQVMKFLPSFFVIKSFSPKELRRYDVMNAWEYQILVDGMLLYQKIKRSFKIPTMVFIDPQDELVNAAVLQHEIANVQICERRYLKKGIGRHHILFHPDYFEKKDWESFTKKVENFLTND